METELFEKTVLVHKDKIYRLAKSMLCNADDAQDAMQEVLGKLWSHRNRLSECDNIAAVALATTRNHCIDILRTRSRRPKISEWQSAENRQSADVVQQIELRDMKAIIEKLIAGLAEKQRIVIHLRDVEGYEFEEIASITGTDEATVRVTLSRARKAIKERLIKIMEHGKYE